MLLGHTAFAEQAFQDPRLDAVHNIEFVEAGNVSSYQATFSIGSDEDTFSGTVSGGATLTASDDDLQLTVSVGDETAFGEAFQNLISFSVGSPDFFLWNEVDDSQTSTWKDVDPGSTD
tara:strand:- start:235 stop:588 length:354 start_codon:yes stop_codon:yes gene_type:complete